MKKCILIISLLLVASVVIASPSFGYLASGKGGSLESSYGGVSLGLVFEPFTMGIAKVETSINIGPDSIKGFCVNDYNISFSTPIFYILSPFDFLFTNKMIWAPQLGVFVGWNASFQFQYGASLSLLHFEEPRFRFDYLAPFIVTSDFHKLGWGLDVLKITYMF